MLATALEIERDAPQPTCNSSSLRSSSGGLVHSSLCSSSFCRRTFVCASSALARKRASTSAWRVASLAAKMASSMRRRDAARAVKAPAESPSRVDQTQTHTYRSRHRRTHGQHTAHGTHAERGAGAEQRASEAVRQNSAATAHALGRQR